MGIIVHKKIGDRVTAGEALCTVHYNSTQRMEKALPLILQSYTIAEAAPELPNHRSIACLAIRAEDLLKAVKPYAGCRIKQSPIAHWLK